MSLDNRTARSAREFPVIILRAEGQIFKLVVVPDYFRLDMSRLDFVLICIRPDYNVN